MIAETLVDVTSVLSSKKGGSIDSKKKTPENPGNECV